MDSGHTDACTDGLPENIMPPVPNGDGDIKVKTDPSGKLKLKSTR